MSEHEETAWFEELYADAEAGRREVPWDRGGPNPFLEQWVRSRNLEGDGRSALVIGTALGDDAELLSGRGYTVTAFEVSPTAIEGARRRFPSSSVDYRVADLLALPETLRGAFDLVAECIIDDRTEDDVRLFVRCPLDQVGGRRDLEQTEVRATGDRQ